MATALTPATDAGTALERADALAQVHAWIAEAQQQGEVEEGVIPDYLAQLLDDAELPFREKIERTGLAALRREQEADAVDVEIKRLQARKVARQREAEHLKQYARLCLTIAGETKVQGALCTVSLQRNPPALRGDVAPATLAALAAAGSPFVRVVPATLTLDRRALLEHAKAGAALPTGLTMERSTSLRLR